MRSTERRVIRKLKSLRLTAQSDGASPAIVAAPPAADRAAASRAQWGAVPAPHEPGTNELQQRAARKGASRTAMSVASAGTFAQDRIGQNR